MSANSKIEWTDHSFNPWIGCTKVSPGCVNCYAESYDKRTSGGKHWGKGASRRRTTDAYWKQAQKWNEHSICGICGHIYDSDSVGFFCGECKQRSIRHQRIFPSLCDWLDPEVPIEWLADLLELIHNTPNLDWLLLTKRPELWKSRLSELDQCPIRNENSVGWLFARQWLKGFIPTNVWLGVSVEDQTRANERIPQLQKIPAAIHFLSCEPLLGRIVIGDFLKSYPLETTGGKGDTAPIDWVIIGGESGPNARPCDVNWIRSIKRQCKSAGVSAFVKQLGANILSRNDVGFEEETPGSWPMDTHTRDIDTGYQGAPVRIILRDRKGGDPYEWPEELRIREFPPELPAPRFHAHRTN